MSVEAIKVDRAVRFGCFAGMVECAQLLLSRGRLLAAGEETQMIISHKYELIFIKTKKTAGTSIEVLLSQYCGPNDIVTPIHPHVEPHVPRNYRGLFNPIPEMMLKIRSPVATAKDLAKRKRFFNHMPASLVKARISRRVWNNYYKFCVERNPWDKCVSHYYMKKGRCNKNLTFDEYISRGEFPINWPLYCDSNGQIIVDQVVYYERLEEELGELFSQLGIPFAGLGVRAKSEYRPQSADYRTLFTERQRLIVEEAFRREIELHGYSF